MKYLVLIPSNQDRNKYADGRHTEYVVMHQIAERAVVKTHDWTDFLVHTVPGQRESKDAWPLEGLYRQQSEAVAWLREQSADPRDAAIVNLHSDAGKAWRHVLGIYGGEIDGNSYRLADAVSYSVEDVFRTADRRMWDYSGYVFYERTRPWAAALIELGSHENATDMNILLTRQDDLATAILVGVQGYLGWNPITEKPPDPDKAYWETFGVPFNPETAIAKYWLACRALGETANLGPAINKEEDGTPYGEIGCVVQRFTNAIVIAKPDEGWKCYRAQVVLEPQRWGLCTT